MIESGKFEYPSQPILLISGNYQCRLNNSIGGVYMCSGLYKSESLTQSIYVGSSEKLNYRVSNHISRLDYNKHKNSLFQNSWNKYGNNNFVWWILEQTSRENQFEREQWYLDNLRPFADEKNGFNIAKYIENNRGRIFTEEERQKMSQRNKGRKMSPESVNKQRAKMARPFKLLSPLGKLEEGLNLNQFCRDHNLNKSHMHELNKGVIYQYKGWTNPDGMKEPPNRSRSFRLKSPDGKIIEGDSLVKFCKENNFNIAGFHKLLVGDCKSNRGYTLPDDTLIIKRQYSTKQQKVSNSE